jgi:hypothetical protein
VYCTAATGWLPNCSSQIYHIISYIISIISYHIFSLHLLSDPFIMHQSILCVYQSVQPYSVATPTLQCSYSKPVQYLQTSRSNYVARAIDNVVHKRIINEYINKFDSLNSIGRRRGLAVIYLFIYLFMVAETCLNGNRLPIYLAIFKVYV